MAKARSKTGVVYDGKILKVAVEKVALPNGRNARLEIIRHPGASAVLPLHKDGKVTLIRQYRHAAGGWIYEVPAGKIDPGDTPEGCASRELEEEVGLTPRHLHPLGSIFTTPGFTDEVIHLFAATGMRRCPPRPEDDEVIEVLKVPLMKALRMIAEGEIQDGKSIACLYRSWHELMAGSFTP